MRAWSAHTPGRAPLGDPDYANVAPDAPSLEAAIGDARKRLTAVHALVQRHIEGLNVVARSAPAVRDSITPSTSRGWRSRMEQACRERIEAWQTLSDALNPPATSPFAPAATTPPLETSSSTGLVRGAAGSFARPPTAEHAVRALRRAEDR